jgi:hypothetical protein
MGYEDREHVVDALVVCFVKVLRDACPHRPLVTRARAPRQVELAYPPAALGPAERNLVRIAAVERGLKAKSKGKGEKRTLVLRKDRPEPAPAPEPEPDEPDVPSWGAALGPAPAPAEASAAGAEASIGLGRIVALHYRSSTSYQIH